MNLEFWRHQYDREWEQREALDSSLGIPVGAVTVLGGALFYLADTYSYDWTATSVAFTISVSFGYISLAAAIYFAIRAVFGYEYARVPTPRQMSEQIKELKIYYTENGEDDEAADQDFIEQMKALYIDATDTNAWNSIRRSTYVHRTKVALIFLLVFTGLAAPVSLLEANGVFGARTTRNMEGGDEGRIEDVRVKAEARTEEAGSSQELGDSGDSTAEMAD